MVALVSKFMMNVIGKSQLKKVDDLEGNISRNPNAIHPTDESPKRFDIVGSAMKRPDGYKMMELKILPSIISSMKNTKKAIKSLSKNPENPEPNISPELLDDLKNFATEIGANSIGFTDLPHKLIFQGKSVMYDKAIVLTYEMDKLKIAEAPSAATELMVMRAYDDLGKIGNKIADFLREHGFAAHASHPLNGLVLYPPLAMAAGLGMPGYQGLLISLEVGPRVRLAAVFTNIENLPVAECNPHEWVREYCDHCRKCIRDCPGDAIYDSAEIKDNGIHTHIDNTKCFPHFINKNSCSICIKVCPFSQVSYDSLKKIWETKIAN